MNIKPNFLYGFDVFEEIFEKTSDEYPCIADFLYSRDQCTEELLYQVRYSFYPSGICNTRYDNPPLVMG